MINEKKLEHRYLVLRENNAMGTLMVLRVGFPDGSPLAQKTMDEITSAIRQAVKEYLQTPDGRKTLKLTNGQFTWGDVPACLPESIAKKHGFCFLDGWYDVHVEDYDESLIDE